MESKVTGDMRQEICEVQLETVVMNDLCSTGDRLYPLGRGICKQGGGKMNMSFRKIALEAIHKQYYFLIVREYVVSSQFFLS